MNTRRYPRTLQEAFGPHTSSRIEEPRRSFFDPEDRPVVWACLVGTLVLVVVLIAERLS